MRELEALFTRRSESAGSTPEPWQSLRDRLFAPIVQHLPEDGPVLAVAVRPVFPIEGIRLTDEVDRRFTQLQLRGEIEAPVVFTDAHMVSASPLDDEDIHGSWHYAEATDDGAIGMRKRLAFTPEEDDVRLVDIILLWQSMRHLMLTAARWPREVCDYDGPLQYDLQLGNVADLVLSATRKDGINIFPVEAYDPPLRRNRQLDWRTDGVWEHGNSVDDCIEGELARLARQLQFRAFDASKAVIRANLHSLERG